MVVDGERERTATGVTSDAAAMTRTCGALATRLSVALAQARAALDAHANELPDGTLAEIDALVAEFARRRVRIAIYGEVKAGKSTLLNAIAGAALSPVAFDPLTSLPVRVTYGPDTAWHVAARRLESVSELERCMREGVGDAREVVVETDLDLLQLGGQVDLLDTPGVGSAAQFDAISADALRGLDAVVLVVRYPALFTQFTRQLMDHLQEDIGKLFVVWNLDADCAELSAVERSRHADNLRTNVAGAHELFLIDARAGFRAMQADDGAGSVASGLTAFIAALRRFASSGGREVAAVREAAKCAQQLFGAAHQRLNARQSTLEQRLTDTRARLDAVQKAADAESAAARGQLADFEAEVSRIGQQFKAAATQREADVRRQLRRARRQWAWSGHHAVLAAAIDATTNRYADAIHDAAQAAAAALRSASEGFGTSAAVEQRPRYVPSIEAGALAPEDRVVLSKSGNAQWLRRSTWQRWYLPGLAALERTAIGEEVRSQAEWLQTASAAVITAARATSSARLSAMAAQAATDSEQIKRETDFDAMQAEFDRLRQDLPVIAAQQASSAQVATAARALQ